MTRVLTIGGATEDNIIHYENAETLNLHSTRGTLSYLLLEEGKKIDVTELVTATGGGATNSAVCFKRLGFEVSACFKVGQDKAGSSIVAELKTSGIDLQHIIESDACSTACSFIVPSLHGDRTVFAYRGANATLDKKDLPIKALAEFDYLYITSLSGNSAQQLPHVTQNAKKAATKVAINPGFSQLKAGGAFIAESLSNIDTLLLNSAEAKQLMVSLIRAQVGQHQSSQIATDNTKAAPSLITRPITHEEFQFNLLDFFERVLNLGPKTVVVTNGDEGVYVAHENTVYFHPSLAVKAINTIGAGDAFSASFVAAIADGLPVATAIRWGISNSASVVGVPDAKSGLLTRDALEKKLKQLDNTLLQSYALS